MSERLRQRALDRYGRGMTQDERTFASFWMLDHWRWIARFCDWDVARYGEAAGSTPWWLRPVAAFVVRCSDWQLPFAFWRWQRGWRPDGWRRP